MSPRGSRRIKQLIGGIECHGSIAGCGGLGLIERKDKIHRRLGPTRAGKVISHHAIIPSYCQQHLNLPLISARHLLEIYHVQATETALTILCTIYIIQQCDIIKQKIRSK